MLVQEGLAFDLDFLVSCHFLEVQTRSAEYPLDNQVSVDFLVLARELNRIRNAIRRIRRLYKLLVHCSFIGRLRTAMDCLTCIFWQSF